MQAQPSRFIFGSIPWYSVLIVLGIVLALLLAQKEANRKHMPKDCMLDIALLIVPAGIVGARLYYVLFQLPYYLVNPLQIFAVWNGGLAIYGAVIAGALAVVLWCKYKRISVLQSVDCIAPGLVLAQAIGRWGNFFNQEAFGRAVTNHSLQFFPYAVYIAPQGYFMATFFYESLWNVLVFICLWHFRKSQKRDGSIFLLYIGLYSAGRAFIEGLRSDSLYFIGLRVSQILSVLFIVCVLLVFAYQSKNKKAYFVVALFLLGILSVFWNLIYLAVPAMALFANLLFRLYKKGSNIAFVCIVASILCLLLQYTELALLLFLLCSAWSIILMYKGVQTCEI
ncbi:MAG: prolipoprotein diacylglyceryl transferase [Eubacteriales bacterium]|nr:prolipoprotein diacylglyceryl transferase [Eubacteriales bacterium]